MADQDWREVERRARAGDLDAQHDLDRISARMYPDVAITEEDLRRWLREVYVRTVFVIRAENAARSQAMDPYSGRFELDQTVQDVARKMSAALTSTQQIRARVVDYSGSMVRRALNLLLEANAVSVVNYDSMSGHSPDQLDAL